MARQAKEHYEAGHWSGPLEFDAETVTLPGELLLKDEAWARCITAVQRGGPLPPKYSNHGWR